LKDPGVLLALVGTMFGAVCQGFIETFLEEYLAIFGLSVSQIGVSFLGEGGTHYPSLSLIIPHYPSLSLLLL